MSGKGNCFDNAMVEIFLKTLKSELVWRTALQTRAEAIAALARYFDDFYNPQRRHSTLGFASPTQLKRASPTNPLSTKPKHVQFRPARSRE